MILHSAVWWKAQLLSNGICIDNSVINNYNFEFIEKRSAYGIQDPAEYQLCRIPQELFILPEEIVCAINIKKESDYVLYYSEIDATYWVVGKTLQNKVQVSFPLRPDFYSKSLTLNNPIKVNQVITLYGGHSLGAFLVRNCWIEKNGVCHFCSLCNNHSSQNDFLNIIDDDSLIESLRIAISENYPITQIMINGGNLADLDVNFDFYVSKIIKIRKMLDDYRRSDIELHLIVSPPKRLSLIDKINSLDIKIAMNMETYDNALFSKYCPGKDRYIGHKHTFDALNKCVAVLGEERVYSIFVGGLEPIDSLYNGMVCMRDSGIVPVINVLHIDPNTFMREGQRPSPEFILKAGALLQNIYSTYSEKFTPFYYKCGRNSIDAEAYLKMFI